MMNLLKNRRIQTDLSKINVQSVPLLFTLLERVNMNAAFDNAASFYPTVNYKFYNYADKKFDDYGGHIHQMTDEYARQHIPQMKQALTDYENLLAMGKCPGEGLLLILVRYA